MRPPIAKPAAATAARALGALLLAASPRPAAAEIIEPTPAWTVYGQDQAHFGFAVGAAGDVDGDGYGDVLAAADYFTNGQAREGGAWLYLGSPNGPATTPAWSVEGNQTNAYLGTALAGAGDVNGDGYDDVLIGIPGFNRAQVYLGSPSGLSPTPAWTVTQSWSFGIAVGAAGDVNGDGYGDIIVGAPNYSNTMTLQGRAYVFHGSPAGLSTTPAWIAEGDQEGGRLGYSVDSAGDVNGDGYDDVIAGASQYDNPELDEGRAYVYHGSATGLATTPAWWAESDLERAYFGISVSTAGDVDGDGYDDVVVGASSYDHANGRAWVFLGSPSGLSPTHAWTHPGTFSEFGIAVGDAGDVDGDGFDEIIVGGPHHSNPEYVEGAAFVFAGGPAGPSPTISWSAEGNLPPPGAGWAGPHLGWAVSGAGDVNGDGAADIIVGAPFSHCPAIPQDCGPIPGWASVYYGRPVTTAAAPAAPAAGLRLLAARPNPFAAGTVLAYDLAEAARVRLRIVDAAGRDLVHVVDAISPPGPHTAIWNGRDAGGHRLGTGIYFARLEVGGAVRTRKLVLAP